MICPQCREAADKVKPKLHKKCSGHRRDDSRLPESSTTSNSHCDCQHRKGQWVIKEPK